MLENGKKILEKSGKFVSLKPWFITFTSTVPKHKKFLTIAVVDPGFPVGGPGPHGGGGVDSRGGYVSKILYVKTKESGPGGACAGHAP